MSTSMVRATLSGAKTQTRRIMNPQPELQIMPAGKEREALELVGPQFDPNGWTWKGCRYLPWPDCVAQLCPYGQPGDRLWVRERWGRCDGGEIAYFASDYLLPPKFQGWKPSIHMFRRDSRITLEIVSVRVERLQDISDADAIAEGIERCTEDIEAVRASLVNNSMHCDRYARLWDAINGPGSWDKNPYVWIIEFRRIKP